MIEKQVIKGIEKVIPIPTNAPTPDKIFGYSIVPKLYGTTFICASKGSGKTNVLWHIIKHCANKKSFLYIFSNTVHSDNNWEYILKELDKRNIQYQVDSDTSDLPGIIEELSNVNIPKPDVKAFNPKKFGTGPTKPTLMSNFIAAKKNKEGVVHGKVAPKYFFIFDDVSEELKSTAIKRFIKQHRHYKTKVIISTQVPIDLDRGLRKNMDQWILFGGHELSRLEQMYREMNVRVPFKTFLELYKEATSEPYAFLNVCNGNDFCQNFDTKLLISK